MVTTTQAFEGRTGFYARSWRLRDTLAAAVLFLFSAGFVLWQNLRVAVLWDLAYLLDSSYRISLGQMPYRDFPFVHPPLAFLIQACLMRMFGRHFLVVATYAAAASGAGTVLAWRLYLQCVRCWACQLSARAWWLSLLLAAPLVFLGVYGIYPHPIYDGDAALAILLALYLLARLEDAIRNGVERTRGLALAAGAACVVPMFFKQNIGLPFLLAVLLGMTLLAAVEGGRGESPTAAIRSPYLTVLAGSAGALAAMCVLIAATVGVGNYVHWTIQFAAQRRMPGLLTELTIYAKWPLLWMLPAVFAGLGLFRTRVVHRGWGRLAAGCLVVSPFLAVLIGFLIRQDMDERADALLVLWPLWIVVSGVLCIWQLRRGITMSGLIPFFALAAIHGAFLSQNLWGSSYAVWALLLLLIGRVLVDIPAPTAGVACATMASGVLLVCGGLYAHSLERLNYIQFPDEPMGRSSIPDLRGMTTQGGYLRDFDELVAFSDREIPRQDALLLLPGEDPFYFATGRAPQFPVLLFDPTTNPYSPEQLMAEAQRRGVRWVIVKRRLQLCDNPFPGFDATVAQVRREYRLFRQLGAYDVYRRP